MDRGLKYFSLKIQGVDLLLSLISLFLHHSFANDK
jgi:hypothetical protein